MDPVFGRRERKGYGSWWWTGFCRAVSLGGFVVDPVSVKQELWIYSHCRRSGSFYFLPVSFVIKSANHLWAVEQSLELGTVTMDSTQLLLVSSLAPWPYPESHHCLLHWTVWDAPSLSLKLQDVTILTGKISGHGCATQTSTHLPDKLIESLHARVPGTVWSISLNPETTLYRVSGVITLLLWVPSTGGWR